MASREASSPHLSIRNLLRPYSLPLAIALVAVEGEGAAGRLETWPLRIVFDNVRKAKPVTGWVSRYLAFASVSLLGDNLYACSRFHPKIGRCSPWELFAFAGKILAGLRSVPTTGILRNPLNLFRETPRHSSGTRIARGLPQGQLKCLSE